MLKLKLSLPLPILTNTFNLSSSTALIIFTYTAKLPIAISVLLIFQLQRLAASICLWNHVIPTIACLNFMMLQICVRTQAVIRKNSPIQLQQMEVRMLKKSISLHVVQACTIHKSLFLTTAVKISTNHFIQFISMTSTVLTNKIFQSTFIIIHIIT